MELVKSMLVWLYTAQAHRMLSSEKELMFGHIGGARSRCIERLVFTVR
jgi:hypothetical protein